MSKHHLVEYIKYINQQEQMLRQEHRYLHKKMQELLRNKVVNGESIEDRIDRYTFGKRDDGNTGYVKNKSAANTDLLHNQWTIIYEPYELERQSLHNKIVAVLYQIWEMESVKRCIDRLLPRQKELILKVYVESMPVKAYCREKQIGHDRYNRLKDETLKTLLEDCNGSLMALYHSWEEKHEEIFLSSDLYGFRTGNPVDHKNP